MSAFSTLYMFATDFLNEQLAQRELQVRSGAEKLAEHEELVRNIAEL